MEELVRQYPDVKGVVSATRGNHGQSIAFSAARKGLRCVIVVPHGNSVEKNAAMRAFGAELIEHGHDFQAASEHTASFAGTEAGIDAVSWRAIAGRTRESARTAPVFWRTNPIMDH